MGCIIRQGAGHKAVNGLYSSVAPGHSVLETETYEGAPVYLQVCHGYSRVGWDQTTVCVRRVGAFVRASLLVWEGRLGEDITMVSVE